jgi:transposase InsO family protein
MEDDKMDLALWRYGIISPLLHRNANDAHLCEMLNVVSESSYIHPSDGRYVTISSEAIRKWLYRFNHGGLNALCDKQRSDSGVHDVPTPIADEMFALRQTHPRWTVALILRELVALKLWDETRPSRSTLYRFARDKNLMRDPHLGAVEVVRPFSFEKFGQMWTADFMHGPKLYMGKKKRKSYLHVIIDDAARYVVSGRFYSSETTQSLISELMTAVRRYGIPQRLYTDNGSAYNSRHLKIICANLAMQNPHTPPRRPQGRAKVERFFRTVRDQFLSRQKYKTFDEINKAFIQYLNDYHLRIHTTLECSPLQKRLGAGNVCRHVPEVADIESLFRLKRRCRVYNDQTIRLHKKVFEVPGCLPGGRIAVYYMPRDLSRVYYGDDMQLAKPVDLAANAYRFDNPTHIREEAND